METRRKQTLLLLILLAFALRVYRLGFQDLRGDEAFDVLFVSQSIKGILEGLRTSQPYPPLFHLLLHFWIQAGQQSEFFLRFPAAFWGTIIVPLTYILGRKLFNTRAAMMAGLMTAFHPFYIWHSQDGRMYTLLVALTLASSLFAYRLWLGQGAWFVYALITALSLLSHYFAWFILIAQNLAFLTIFKRQSSTKWWIAQATVFLLTIPWLLFAWPLLVSHRSGWIKPANLFSVLWRCFLAYSTGLTVKPEQIASSLVCFFACFLSGFLLQLKAKEIQNLLLLIFVPIIATFIGSQFRPMFDERYLIFIIPFYLTIVAKGLAWLEWRLKLTPALAAFPIIGGMFCSLINYYFNPQYAKSPPWRSLITYIHEQSLPGDVIIQTYPDPSPVYYNQRKLPFIILTSLYPQDLIATPKEIERLASEYKRIWLIPISSSSPVEEWLNRRCDKIKEERIGPLHLKLYLTYLSFLTEMEPVNADLGGVIKLLGYKLDKIETKPGGTLNLTLYWKAMTKMEYSYTVFTHIINTEGKIWGQKDNPPVGGAYPTTEWTAGEIVVDKYEIALDPETPPGKYLLEVGMYRLETMERLPVYDRHGRRLPEDRILLKPIVVVK